MKQQNDVVFPILTVDGIIFQLIHNKLTVLLITRSRAPFKGKLALPGGYNPAGETTRQALNRVLRAKTGVRLPQLGLVEQLYTFDTVARDPRGHAVSVVYLGLCQNVAPGMKGDTQSPQFYPVDSLAKLAYDHNKLVSFARERLKKLVASTNSIAALMPQEFTLTQLQMAYEAVLGKPLDKRNFRKKILALGFLAETAHMSRGNTHRPARLYAFRSAKVESITQSFD